jgi:hypothetical protein
MPVIIPTRTDLASYAFSIELEAVVYRFRFQFNERDQSWFFDLLTEDGVPIRQGLKVVTNFPLLLRIASDQAPPGQLYAIDTTGEDLRAGLEDLGDQVQLVYFSEDELPEDLFADR